MTTRAGNWIQTYTGKCFYPLDPRPSEVDILDIAHALSMKCRYGGHAVYYYSVAEHSVLVSHHVPPEFALWGLLHDAAEAYSADIPRPLKVMIPGWPQFEQRIMAAIGERYGLVFPEPPEVTAIDNRILVDERAVLMNPCDQEWNLPFEAIGGVDIKRHSPLKAKTKFLARFFDLTKRK